jgi:competence protein ComEC
MGAATTVAALAGRPASRWYALLLAAAATLALNPRASGDAGWQLSFAAVVAIALLTPTLSAALRSRRVPRSIAEALAVTLAATLGTAPLIALRFSELSLVSVPANLLAAPAVAPIMWLGMLAAALGQVATALALPLNLLGACLLGYVGWVAHAAAGAPHASVTARLGGPLALVATYAAMALLGLAARRLARRVALAP